MTYSPSVKSDISLRTGSITRAGFGTILFVSAHSLYSDRVRSYGSLDAMLEDGFLSTDNAYVAATHVFSQSPSTGLIKIGRREEQVIYSVSTPASTPNEIYSFDIVLGSGYTTTISYTATAGTEDEATIIAGLKAAFDADDNLTDQLTAVENSSGVTSSLTIRTNTGDEFFNTNSVVGFLSESVASVENPAETIKQIVEEDSDFFFITAEDHSATYIKLMAAQAESRKKMYFTSLYDSTQLTAYTQGDVTNVANELRDLGYNNTAVLFHQRSDEFIETGYVGVNAPYDAGSVTWCNVEITGAGTSTNPDTGKILSETSKANLEDKNVNYVEQDPDAAYVRSGATVSGEWIDVIRGKFWLESEIATEMKYLLKFQKGGKVAMNEIGENQVREVLLSVLQRAYNRGFINSDFKVTVPNINALAPSERATRILEGVKFTATLSGAIHQIFVEGTLSS